MSDLQTFGQLLDERVDDKRFNLPNIPYIKRAVKSFENDVPKKETATVTVLSSGEREFGVPTNFNVGYGMDGIISVEYPKSVATDSRPIFIYLSPKWAIREKNSHGLHLYDRDGTIKIRFSTDLTEDFRIQYRLPYTVDDDSSDVSTIHDQLVADLAGYYKALAIAQRYSGIGDETQVADLINYGNRASQFFQLSRDLKKAYDANVLPYRFQLDVATSEVDRNYPRVIR